MPVEPVPMTATRLPVKPTPSWGHRPVWYRRPPKRSIPSNRGPVGDRQAAGRHDQKTRGNLIALLGPDGPQVSRRVERRARHPPSRSGSVGGDRAWWRRARCTSGSRAARSSAPAIATPGRAPAGRSRSSSGSRCRSGRPGNDSSTRCRQRPCPPRSPAPRAPAGAAGASCRDRRIRRRRRRHRDVPCFISLPYEPMVRSPLSSRRSPGRRRP